MEKIVKTFNIYSFDELKEVAKERAISDHIDFMIETRTGDADYGENWKKAIVECEKMLTPWFFGQYVYEYCKDEAIESMKISDYKFLKTGQLYY